MITGGTLHKDHFFETGRKLYGLQDLLFQTARRFGWTLGAWSLFSNHYHLISSAQRGARSLSRWLQRFHSVSARMVNGIDETPGRKVWYQFWDKTITFEASYWARLNYVTQNPVRHGLVARVSDYPFCSARWIELEWSSAKRKKLESFRHDRIQVFDEFDPVAYL